ncbi:hypothetical protein LWC33_23710 [Pseudonocardia sp. RS11V-5]|uniref:sigma-54-dependent Fis family transcriptional regulator n=1 Tax=Pseudonocardia terrae TaxID=2905831 RepID=UPI001E30589B|nr:helix-turn-helix domain-containing protein [Pseudonocardia terrae]MCE3554450.1 hypothetical protein [Pseudonocardia terrae]
MPLHNVDTALARNRDRFLISGREPNGVRADILQSWRRSATLSIQPDSFSPLYQPDELNPDGRLLRAAEPVLRHLTSKSGDLGLGFLVTDDEARILARWTDSPAMLRLLDKVSADRGHVFSEDIIGTNGLGTAVELGRVVRVDGREHYADILGEFTCVGVPIRDPLARRMIGVLDITCAADHDNKLITLLATQTAEKIEQSMYEQQSPREQALLRHFLAARRTTGGVVVVSERLMLADPRAGRLLEGFDQPLLWERASRALAASRPVEEELETAEGRTLATTMTAINEGGEVLGVILQIRPRGRERPQRRRPAEAADEHRPGLVGESAGLRAAFRACRDASEHSVVLISGEQGVGKSALARSVHLAGPARELHICDCDVETDGLLAWYDALRTTLAGDPGTLLIPHVDLLPESERKPVGGLLRIASGRGWRILMTAALGGPRSARTIADQMNAVEVVLTPLRDRIEDVPPLAELFAAPRKLTPEVTQLLIRLLWPGNVRELETTIARIMSAGLSQAPIRLTDIPPELAANASRRALTRFERAEISALLNALADCDGNKTEAAKLAGVSRSTFYRKLRAGGIDLENTAF